MAKAPERVAGRAGGTFLPVAVSFQGGRQASFILHRSWQSSRGAFRASGTAGVEPAPSESEWLDTAFALAQRGKEGVTRIGHGPKAARSEPGSGGHTQGADRSKGDMLVSRRGMLVSHG